MSQRPERVFCKHAPPPPPSLSLLPCGCASFRCPPPQRRALRRRGAPFSPGSDRKGDDDGGGGVGKMLVTAPVDVPSVRCVLCALGSFPVVSKSNCIPSTSSLSSLARSPSLRTLHGAGYERTDIHSGAAASSSTRAIAPAPCMTSGGEGGGGDLAQGLGFIPCVLDCKGGMSGNSNQPLRYCQITYT